VLFRSRRLAYVAITRARERLYLTHAHSRSLFGATQHNAPSRFIGEIPGECVEASGVGSSGFGGAGGWEKRGDRRGTFGHGTGDGGGRVFGSGSAANGSAAPRAGGGVKPKATSETFEVGDTVDHKAFGRGRVMAVRGDQLEIRFDRTGEAKKLLVGYAPIVKVK